MTSAEPRAVTRAPLAASLLLALGGLGWIIARYGVMTTWEGSWLGLDYVGWNRLVLVALLLLATAAAAAARASDARRTRVAWIVLAVGFAIAATGVAIEFVVGGGLRGGPESIAVAGWLVYLLGHLVVGVASLMLAVALARARRRAPAVAAAVAGIATIAWPVTMMAPGLEEADQVLIGSAWIALGALIRWPLSRPAPLERP